MNLSTPLGIITGILITSAFLCFSSIISIAGGFTFLKALVAPRLVILEYLKGLL